MRWEEGVWLGVRDKSGEMYIGTEHGAIKVRSVRRKGTAQERWDESCWARMQGVPWEPVPGREGFEVGSRVVMPTVPTEVPPMREGPAWEQ